MQNISQMKPGLAFVILYIVALMVTFTSQYLRDVYGAELFSDATGHYITTLMVHDYLLTGFSGNPLEYAREYFIHYPSIRIGNNPPTFYALSAPWALLTSDTIASALALSAILAALYCAIVGFWACRLHSFAIGLTAAIFVGMLPSFQRITGEFLIDIPIGIASLLAIFVYAKFLHRPSLKLAVGFSALALLALWIKGSAIFLGLMVPLAVLVSGRYALLKRWEFWLPALIVGLFILPWYLYTFRTFTAGVKTQWDLTYPFLAAAGYTKIFIMNFTLPGFALGVAGLWDRLRFIRANRNTYEADQWSVIIALLFAVLIFQIFLPVNILQRYMITAFGPFAMLLWPGAVFCGRFIAERLPRSPVLSENLRTKFPQMVFALGLAFMLTAALTTGPKPSNQMRPVAHQVAASLPANNPVVVIGSDGSREATFMAELAQLDRQRPSMIAIRGGRLFGDKSGFMNVDYKPRFNTTEEVLGELERLGIALVIVDRAAAAQLWAHNKMLAELTDKRPELWQKLWSMDNPGRDGDLSLYLLKSTASRTADMALLRHELRPGL